MHSIAGSGEVAGRAARHAALGDPARLAIVDELSLSDRAPIELGRRLGMESNLLAHHLETLERVGLIERFRSSGDGRRRYVHLRHGVLDQLTSRRSVPAEPALFVCTANSARSQIAAAMWSRRTGHAGASAGTHPAPHVNPGAVAAARRHGLELTGAVPRSLDEIDELPPLVVTVCDRAHEELADRPDWLHWSILDPVIDGSAAAFDATIDELGVRIDEVTSRW